MSEDRRSRWEKYAPLVIDQQVGMAKIDTKGSFINDYYGGVEFLVSVWLEETIEETLQEIASMLTLYYNPAEVAILLEQFQALLSEESSHDQNVA